MVCKVAFFELVPPRATVVTVNALDPPCKAFCTDEDEELSPLVTCCCTGAVCDVDVELLLDNGKSEDDELKLEVVLKTKFEELELELGLELKVELKEPESEPELDIKLESEDTLDVVGTVVELELELELEIELKLEEKTDLAKIVLVRLDAADEAPYKLDEYVVEVDLRGLDEDLVEEDLRELDDLLVEEDDKELAVELGGIQ